MNLLRYRSQGMTLVELLASVALASLLMVVLLQVIVAIGRDRHKVSAEEDSGSAWSSQIHDVLRSDLDVAHSVRWEESQLVIEGAGALDAATLAPVHLPARVRYLLVDVDGNPMSQGPAVAVGLDTGGNGLGALLVREQEDLLDLSQRRPNRTLVAIHVRSFGMQGATEATRLGDGPAAITDEDALGEASSARLVVQFDNGNEVSVIHERLQVDQENSLPQTLRRLQAPDGLERVRKFPHACVWRKRSLPALAHLPAATAGARFAALGANVLARPRHAQDFSYTFLGPRS